MYCSAAPSRPRHYAGTPHTYGKHSISFFAKLALALLLVFSSIGGMASSPVIAAGSDYFGAPKSKGFLGTGYALRPFSFIVATDSHFGSSQGNKNGATALRSVAQYFPDSAFMIHMGDITETGKADQYDIFVAEAKNLPFPIMSTMGNHESRWEDPQGSLFRKHFGPTSFSFDFGSWHFVVLDTTSPGETVGTVDPSIWSWLDKDLKGQSTGKPVAIFSHHPLLYQPTRFQDSDDSFLEILAKYPIKAVFSGHGHSFIHWKAQGRDCAMIGALMDGAYAKVEVKGTDMIITREKAIQADDGSIRLEEERWVTIPFGEVGIPENPITNLQLTYNEGILYYEFTLSQRAPIAFQIDGGYYNDIGEMPSGTHHLTVDVSQQARGIHSFRLKAVTSEGPFFYAREFGKDVEGLFAWQKDLGSALSQGILSDDDERVILGTKDGNVFCLSSETGEVLWKYSADAPWGGGVIDQDTNRIFFGTAKGDVHCVDLSNGSFVWRKSLDDRGFLASPRIFNTSRGKLIFLGSSSGNMYALDAITAEIKWRKKVGAAIPSTPSVSSDLIFFGAWDSRFYALNALTGEEVWSKQLGRQTYYSPVSNSLIFGHMVFVPTPSDAHSGGSYLYALDTRTGNEMYKGVSWPSFMEPSLPISSRKAQTNVPIAWILTPDYSGRITAIEPNTGQILWSLKGSSTLFSGISNLDSYLVTGGSRGVINILNSKSAIDIKMADTFLLTKPKILRFQITDGQGKYLVIQGDTKGRLTAVIIPE